MSTNESYKRHNNWYNAHLSSENEITAIQNCRDPQKAIPMTKIKYFIYAATTLSIAVCILVMLLLSVNLHDILNAFKALLLPGIAISLIIFLLAYAVSLIVKGKRVGKPKKHIRFR